MTAQERRRAKLRSVAEHHAWELAGFCDILWPRSPARLALLRDAWLEIAPAALAGRLVGPLECLNGAPGFTPRAAELWGWGEDG